jgi:hypothetical protein
MIHRVNLVTCGLALTLASAACEGEGGDGGAFGQFVGRWEYTQGTSTETCPSGPESAPLKGWIELYSGVDSALVAFDGPCALRFDASGNTATIKAGQSCEDEVGESETLGVVTAKRSYGSFTFNVSGIMATESASMTEVLSASKGRSISCTIMRMGTLRKVTK